MGGHPYWRGEGTAEPDGEGRRGAPLPRSERLPAQARWGFVVFALLLTVALGTVLMLIAAGSVQAMSHSAALHAKSDGWLGLTAIGAVLVSAFIGMVIVHRYTSRHR
jgi:divalent metal cation (Fe/Co/Zn/Cd) transporter